MHQECLIVSRECSKKSVQQGRSPFDARSVLSVRERGKRATMSVRAASGKPENAAGGFFQHSLFATGKTSGCANQGLEKLFLDGVFFVEKFGVPLDAEEKIFVWGFDGFDDAIG